MVFEKVLCASHGNSALATLQTTLPAKELANGHHSYIFFTALCTHATVLVIVHGNFLITINYDFFSIPLLREFCDNNYS